MAKKKYSNKNNCNTTSKENNYNNTLVFPYFSIKFNMLPKMLKPLGINKIFTFRNCHKNILIKNPPLNNSNIVYKIPFSNCKGYNKSQSGKNLETRIKQYVSYIGNMNNNSPLLKNSYEQERITNWENSCKIINSSYCSKIL